MDFQDAVWGPVTYDLVSLLKDCYIAWPRAAGARTGPLQYREQLAGQRDFPLSASEAEFIRWFDLIGLQRHIKVLGIFARLFYRDGKSQYLKDLPRVLALYAGRGRRVSRDRRSSPNSSPGASIRSFASRAAAGARVSAGRPQAAPRAAHDSGGRARRAHAAADRHDAEAAAARCAASR